MLEGKKAQARLSILEKLRKQGAPVSPFPGEITAEDNLDASIAGEQEAEEDSLDQLGGELLPGLAPGRKLKKRPTP